MNLTTFFTKGLPPKLLPTRRKICQQSDAIKYNMYLTYEVLHKIKLQKMILLCVLFQLCLTDWCFIYIKYLWFAFEPQGSPDCHIFHYVPSFGVLKVPNESLACGTMKSLSDLSICSGGNERSCLKVKYQHQCHKMAGSYQICVDFACLNPLN